MYSCLIFKHVVRAYRLRTLLRDYRIKKAESLFFLLFFFLLIVVLGGSCRRLVESLFF